MCLNAFGVEAHSIDRQEYCQLADEVVGPDGLAAVLAGTLGSLCDVLVKDLIETIQRISTDVDFVLLQCGLGLTSDEQHLFGHNIPFPTSI